jgi:hypothetical protein
LAEPPGGAGAERLGADVAAGVEVGTGVGVDVLAGLGEVVVAMGFLDAGRCGVEPSGVTGTGRTCR